MTRSSRPPATQNVSPSIEGTPGVLAERAARPVLTTLLLLLGSLTAHAADTWSISFEQPGLPQTGGTIICQRTGPCSDTVPLSLNGHLVAVNVLAWINDRTVRISFATDDQAPPIRFENGIGRPWKLVLDPRGRGRQSFTLAEAFDHDTTLNQVRTDDLVIRREPRLGTVEITVAAR